MKTNVIFSKSKSDFREYNLPNTETPQIKLDKFVNKKFLRKDLARLPQVSEPEVVRHFTNLSTKNHHVDKNFYPLGSCTMKYNPKINDYIAMQPNFAGIHPHQKSEYIQGTLKIYHELGNLLCEITGMDGITLQPSAGSQGEMVGLLLMKKYHQLKGNKNKKYVIIPKTAHGTNPASVVMSGYKIKQVDSDERGRVSISHLKDLIDDETAGFMLTQPNTLGLFEDNIELISSMIHKVDGLMYMDGANLNALVGMVNPAKMGFDITHINVHKTFSTPHGGGGPGAGPVAVNAKLKEYLPNPIIDFKDGKYFYRNLENSIGRVHAYFGNFGVLIRAYVYILTLGKEGLRQISQHAVLNANYLKTLLSKVYNVPFSDGTMHEFVISAIEQKKQGIKAIDIAKNLLDYGVHSPTIYFPTNVPEAIMIEPTETETKETLEFFADKMIYINENILEKHDYFKEAPYNTPVRKLNETKANRELNVKWKFDDEV